MRVDWLSIIAMSGAIGTFVGLALTVIYSRRADRRKMLVHDVAPPLALANILPDRTDHRLSIVYEREGSPAMNVRGAFLRFIQLGNLGKEPIRRDDIAPGDPLRLEVDGARVLDMAVSAVSRDVINFGLTPFSESPGGKTSSLMSFDFLDSQDGALIRVLTDNAAARLRIAGTIIGMPQGVLRTGDLGQNRVLNAVGCGLAVLLQLSAIAGALFIFRTVTGGWSSLWIFLLPIAALFLPAIVVGLVASTVWPSGPRWPGALSIPDWFVSTYSMRRDMDRYSELDAEVMSRRAVLERLEREASTINQDRP